MDTGDNANVGPSVITSIELWYRMVMVRTAVHMQGQRKYGYSVVSAQFCCDTKTVVF
jgi:hypothetical protein